MEVEPLRNLFGEVIVEGHPPHRIARSVPAATTWFLVASWYAPDARWKLWRDQWLTRERAVEWATNRLTRIRGHTHYCILEMRLPGEDHVD